MLAAAIQLSSTPDRDRNVEAADRLVRRAAAAGAELVVLPEKWPVLAHAHADAGPSSGSAAAAVCSGVPLSGTATGVGLGLAVCYDLRFPELFRLLAVRGARILVLPAAFTVVTTREHWEVLLRARAIEQQCFVVAANQVGEHAPGLRSGGRSMIVDPWGIVLAQAPDTETFVLADLDLDRQDDIRRKLPSLVNRRPAAYGWPASAAR